MNHVDLHNELSEIFKQLRSGKIKPKDANVLFNGAGKVLANCKNELFAIGMGAKIDVPLLGIKAKDWDTIQLPPLDKTLKEIEANQKKPYEHK